MGQYLDLYYLIENRNSQSVKEFIKNHIPINKESSDEYEFPLFSDNPEYFFDDVGELLMFLESHKDFEYSIYWENLDQTSIIKHFMVFHTDDGKMIFGISINGREPYKDENVKFFNELKDQLGSKIGCITVEEVPPSNSGQFIDFCNNRW